MGQRGGGWWLDIPGQEADFGVWRQAVKVREEDQRRRDGSSHGRPKQIMGFLTCVIEVVDAL
jgi:hypothetical protein